MSDEGREDWLVERFERIGAVELGHFVAISGLHFDRYVVKDLVTSYPRLLDELANHMVLINDRQWAGKVDLVVAPAVGAVVLGGMLANHLNCRFVFTEKDSEDNHKIRDSLSGLIRGSRVLVSEDIVTSGKTVLEVASLVSDQGAVVVGASVLWVRGKDVRTVFPVVSLINKVLPDWDEKVCPLCKRFQPIRTDLGHGGEFLAMYGTDPINWPANKLS